LAQPQDGHPQRALGRHPRQRRVHPLSAGVSLFGNVPAATSNKLDLASEQVMVGGLRPKPGQVDR
jgi:hypothetical protein